MPNRVSLVSVVVRQKLTWLFLLLIHETIVLDFYVEFFTVIP